MPQVAYPVVAFPESPSSTFLQCRVNRLDHRRIPRCPTHPRPVVRRPRQPGNLASTQYRQTFLLGHHPDRLALGRRRQSFRLSTSLIAEFSNARSAYIGLSLAFSASSSFRRFNSAILAPP